MAKQTKLKQLKLKEKEQNELFPHKINGKIIIFIKNINFYVNLYKFL